MKNVTALLIGIVASTFIASAAFALSLDDAKQQGLVGEQITGYLGTVKATAEASALVADINGKRKAKYREIAQRNGASLESVEKLAGKTAIEKTAAGHYINLGNGWQQK